MRMAALLMAMIALLGSPQGEGTVSETTWEMVAVQVLEETPETAARTLLDWAGSGQTIPEEDVVLALLEEMEAEPAASAVAFAAVLDRADSLRKGAGRRDLPGGGPVPVPLFHQASGDGDHALAGGALCLACGFGCV